MTAVALFGRQQGQGPPIVILHGLFGASRNWSQVLGRLAPDWTAAALDLRNHGQSPWSNDMSYGAMAEDLLAYMDGQGWSQAVLLGHSMGGKAAMALALTAPERVRALVVVDMAPRAYESGLDRYIHALTELDLTGLTRRGEVDQALAPTVPEKGLRDFLLQNLLWDRDHFTWRLNLAVLERAMADLVDFPEDLQARCFAGPAHFISGARSDYVREGDRPHIRKLFPKAGFQVVPEAGHWVHAEAPEPFFAALSSYLARL
ncbi:MAG: alpha/beta fold hydrolase [Pseudomonadota bacterium]